MYDFAEEKAYNLRHKTNDMTIVIRSVRLGQVQPEAISDSLDIKHVGITPTLLTTMEEDRRSNLSYISIYVSETMNYSQRML
jgi:hypothetical protein